jgi:DNA repair protein RadC
MRIYEASLKYKLVQSGPLMVVDSPERVFQYMEGAFDPDPTVEWFFVIPLNRKNRALGRIAITKGTATASLVHPREVFRPAVLCNASALIVAHNHPSGDPAPSQADIRATRQLKEAAKTMQIDLLDHLIVGDKDADPCNVGYYSFSEAGLI